MRKYSVNETFFDNWTAEMAYVLGLLTADGNVYYNQVGIAVKESDEELAIYVRDCLSPTAPIAVKKTTMGEQQKRCRVHSTKLASRLAELGVVPNKTGKELVPKDLPDDLLGHYIRGVFDGDGCIHCRPDMPLRAMIFSASQTFLEELQRRCEGLGKISKSSMIWRWNMNTRETFVFRDLLYGQGGFCLERKRRLMFSIEPKDVKKHSFLPYEDNIIKSMLDDGRSFREIGVKLNRGSSSIYMRAIGIKAWTKKRHIRKERH